MGSTYASAECLHIPFEQLFHEVPCYITVQDRELTILENNRRFQNDFGQGIGKKCYAFYKNRKEPCVVCPVVETFDDGKYRTSEEILTNAKGEQLNVLVRTSPLRNKEGEIVAVMEMVTNITEFKKVQSQLSGLGQMIANLAHSVKGIVQSLKGANYILESGFQRKDDAMIQKGWDMMQRNIRIVSQLVMDMLYYAKPRQIEPKLLNPVKIIEDICEMNQERCRRKNIQIETNFQKTEKFEGDAQAIHSLIMNLVENAIDACKWDKAKESHTINVIIQGDEHSIEFRISDDGTGMDEETRTKIFSPFFSTKGTTGTGIGMVVAKKIVNEHHGTITVESVLGSGSTFIITIPRKFSGILSENTTGTLNPPAVH